MSVTLYGYTKCGTCRNARKWLEAEGVTTEFIDLVETPPTATQLRLFVEQSGLDLSKFFNTSGEVYKQLKLKDKLANLTRDEKISLLSANGKLIKRPIVTDGKRVTVGFKTEEYRKVWINA
ncbi:MAG: arsenate reductase family protein [Gorillibacterium sp.]|nr:arsenate reductase family protein [Gorillibacterium sp.]